MAKKSSTRKKTATTTTKTATASVVRNESPYSLASFLDFINNNFSLIFLFAVIFIVGFVIGSLWTEKQMLKSGTGTKEVAQEIDPAEAAIPQGPSEETLKLVPKVTEADHLRGSMNAKVTIIEYSDFECPFCNRFHPTMNQIMDEYGDQVAWVYRHYPLGFHQNAQKLAELSECVAKLGGDEKFWQFADSFFTKFQQDETLAQIPNALALVTEIGLNQSAVSSCVESGEMASLIQEQVTSGEKAGVSGTPNSILVTADGQYEFIPGALPIDQIKTIIEKYL